MAEKNGVASVELQKKACSFGIKNDCFRAGHIYYSGKYNLKKEMKSAVEFLEKACEAEHKGGCYYMGWIYEYGEFGKKDKSKASEYYQKSCNLGFKDACKKALE